MPRDALVGGGVYSDEFHGASDGASDGLAYIPCLK
jgi:hypothetical protein